MFPFGGISMNVSKYGQAYVEITVWVFERWRQGRERERDSHLLLLHDDLLLQHLDSVVVGRLLVPGEQNLPHGEEVSGLASRRYQPWQHHHDYEGSWGSARRESGEKNSPFRNFPCQWFWGSQNRRVWSCWRKHRAVRMTLKTRTRTKTQAHRHTYTGTHIHTQRYCIFL